MNIHTFDCQITVQGGKSIKFNNCGQLKNWKLFAISRQLIANIGLNAHAVVKQNHGHLLSDTNVEIKFFVKPGWGLIYYMFITYLIWVRDLYMIFFHHASEQLLSMEQLLHHRSIVTG